MGHHGDRTASLTTLRCVNPARALCGLGQGLRKDKEGAGRRARNTPERRRLAPQAVRRRKEDTQMTILSAAALTLSSLWPKAVLMRFVRKTYRDYITHVHTAKSNELVFLLEERKLISPSSHFQHLLVPVRIA